jgi:hypothetical protein
MLIADISDKLLTKEGGSTYYSFSNADGKQWLMPARNMRVAMNLYQPSGRNGKIVKFFFPWVHSLPFVRRAIHAERMKCSLNEDLRTLLAEVFRTEDFDFAMFFGTPSVHQKITVQISKANRILGYCKVTDSEEIAALFHWEEKVLRLLGKSHLTGLPRCLYCGQMASGYSLFIQSTTKTQKSQVVHDWTNLHENFLDKLYNSTRQELLFEQSDYYQTMIDLQQHINWLPNGVDGKFVESVIQKVLSDFSGKRVAYSAYHADFTPWNMFVEEGELFVFDWEYSRMTYPPLLDRYHFFTQTAVFEKRWQAKEIISFLHSSNAACIEQEIYTLYLLDVISRFTIREKGKIEGDVARSMTIWIDLLVYLNT